MFANDFQFLVVVLALAFFGAVFSKFARDRRARKSKMPWEPALDPKADVHVLGADFPQSSGTFMNGLVSKRYTVPKDPQEYAKLFVPETKDKGQQE